MTSLQRRLPRFYDRLDHLSAVIATVDANPARTTAHVFSAEKAIIQLQIEWEHFVRNLILDSATGQFVNAGGRIVSRSFPSICSRESAAHTLVGTYSRRRFEPDWYLPRDAIDAAIRLDLTNVAQIAAELGITPWPIEELRHVRNFVAHKSKRAALNIRSLGLIPTSENIDVLELAFAFTTGGSKRYSEWVNFSKAAASRLVQ